MSLPHPDPAPLAPGLYFVATPIGSARDITLRALDILRGADVIAAEDTRTLRKLLEIHGVPLAGRQVLPYHDHNGPAMRPKLLALLAEGRSVAYASDAGTPLVADPGYALGRDAIAAGLPVTGAPGPSAVLAALTLSGLPSDRFLFAGFLPPAQAARRQALTELGAIPATLVLFEAPKRCAKTLNDMVAILGEDRRVALCRELTKKFEEVRRGTVAEIAEGVAQDPPRGEIVLVIDRDRRVASVQDMETALKVALETMSMKDAARDVADALGLARRDVYQAALAMGRPR